MKPQLCLALEHLSYEEEEGLTVLSDIHLQVFEGERVGVIGPNGKGKTTLFLLIAGIYKPSGGEIRLFDQDIRSTSFNPRIGMIFQNQDDQLFSPTVHEDIAFGPRNMGWSAEKIEASVNTILKSLQISHLKEKPPHHLSGGEKRLVAIAGMLVMKPQFMIWDEPSSNLDMRYRRRVIELIQSASPEESMLIASHDLEFILEVCNRVIILDDGCIIADGAPSEVLKRERVLLEHGLEVPFSLR